MEIVPANFPLFASPSSSMGPGRLNRLPNLGPQRQATYEQALFAKRPPVIVPQREQTEAP
jgi:hypothetical protein